MTEKPTEPRKVMLEVLQWTLLVAPVVMMTVLYYFVYHWSESVNARLDQQDAAIEQHERDIKRIVDTVEKLWDIWGK